MVRGRKENVTGDRKSSFRKPFFIRGTSWGTLGEEGKKVPYEKISVVKRETDYNAFDKGNSPKLAGKKGRKQKKELGQGKEDPRKEARNARRNTVFRLKKKRIYSPARKKGEKRRRVQSYPGKRGK